MRILKFYKHDYETTVTKNAVITKHNCYYRVCAETELFFNEFNNAIKFLLDNGYIMENLF